MAHLGRHHHAVDVWRAMASSFADTIGALSAAWGGWTPREIDVGGGFASPRDPTGRATTRGMQRPTEERSPSIEAYADAVATSLRDGLDATASRRTASGWRPSPDARCSPTLASTSRPCAT